MYPVTAMLSVAAVQEKVIEVVVAEARVSAVGALGAVVSGHAAVAADSVARVDRLPAAS